MAIAFPHEDGVPWAAPAPTAGDAPFIADDPPAAAACEH